jgi:hypothetical protein
VSRLKEHQVTLIAAAVVIVAAVVAAELAR